MYDLTVVSAQADMTSLADNDTQELRATKLRVQAALRRFAAPNSGQKL